MTNQNVKLSERGSCTVYHCNRGGKDSFSPRIWGLFGFLQGNDRWQSSNVK